MHFGIPYFGELLSFLTAFVWAMAVILFKKSGETVHPIALNMFKNILAMVLLLPTMLMFGEDVFYSAPADEYWWLIISGAIGIGVGDTLFFKGLNLLGAGLLSIVDTLYLPMVIFLSIIWLGESLSIWQFVGVAAIIGAIILATYEKRNQKLSRRNLIWGTFYGLMAMAAMAVSIVFTKPLLERSPIIWLTEVRLVGGVITLLIVFAFHKSKKQILISLTHIHGLKYMFWGSFLGAYLSMMIWLTGMKYAQASVASALNQTSNVLIFVLAALFLKERFNFRRIAAIVIAMTGVFLVTFG
ncbi:MAG: DMT family transporter [candidate division Zixibacteria bacterium]|nr:DMT family transporter [candidate division Zixibacteria bacterium]